MNSEREKTALIFATTGPVKKVYLTGQNAEIVREKYNGRRVILGIRPEDIYEYEEAKALGTISPIIKITIVITPVVIPITAELK